MSDIPLTALIDNEALMNACVQGAVRGCMEMITATIASIEPDWIPVTERMPEEQESEINTFDNNMNVTGVIKRTISNYCLVTIQPKGCAPHVGTSFSVDGKFPDDVIAWMPLPEPYKEDKE